MNHKTNDLKKIIRLDSTLHKIQDVDILLERILFEARTIVNADAGSIYVVEGNNLAIKYSQNDTLSKELPPGHKLIYSIFSIEINKKTISGYVGSTGKLLNIPDAYKIPSNASYQFDPKYDEISGYKTGSVLTIPLKTSNNKILGVLQIINAKDEQGKIISFSKEDEFLMMHFADNATITLERAQMTRAILLRMIKMAELRDPKETGPHVNRVASYAVEIYEHYAAKHKIPQKQIQKNRDTLRMAAMLHDVGKVAISDTILKKPDKFNKEEFEIMKAHTYLGARLFLDKQSELDEVAMQIALTHHEKWNGHGYPGRINIKTCTPLKNNCKKRLLGLKKQEIPLWGRIVAIADVYDALTSKRVYKKKWKDGRVLEEMQKLSGKYFDPELINIFLEIIPNIKQVAKRYKEKV